MRPFMDKVMPEAWKASVAFASTIRDAAAEGGLAPEESELIKVRASQINACVFCLDLHSREARRAGISQQKLDVLSAWRESSLFDARERAVLAVAEATSEMPLSERAATDLESALAVLGESTFVAAEWVAIAINAFNRISILSEHPVRPRGLDGQLIR